MSLFKKLGNLFSSISKRRKQEEEFSKLDYGNPAKPKNLMPLDPNDPWKT
jgi:hypothetical protein